jgi:hypothetical protein
LVGGKLAYEQLAKTIIKENTPATTQRPSTHHKARNKAQPNNHHTTIKTSGHQATTKPPPNLHQTTKWSSVPPNWP